MIKQLVFYVALLGWSCSIFGQNTGANPLIHSHNDYLNEVPFYEAFINGASSIEMDIHYYKDELYVAHDFDEIIDTYTFEELYIKPLQMLVHRGVFPEKGNKNPLIYLFDIKSNNSITCLKKLESICSKYPEIFGSNSKPSLVNFIISGNRPSPKDFGLFSSFILFDGRPHVNYSSAELKKVGLISENFRKFSRWNGKGRLIKEDLDTIEQIISKVHALGKPIRFWATPDSKSSWDALAQLKVDFVNTDNTKALSEFYKKRENSRFKSPNGHAVYPLDLPSFGPIKNVILMIGDGMGLAQLSSGLLANKGVLNMGNFQHYGFSMTQAADDFTTDSAAGGTAMASGVKTKNRYIGMDAKGQPIQSLVDLAYNKGLKTGIVTTDNLTGATPSAFYAHQIERDLSRNIVDDFTKSTVDLFIGNGKRALDSLFDKGVEVLRKNGFVPLIDEFNLSNSSLSRPVLLVSNTKANGRNGDPTILKKMTNTAINYLNKDDDQGFFLMIESSKIDSGGHNNFTEQVVEEVLAFDKAIGEVLKFAQQEGNTLVIVTADHETGGMSLPQGNIEEGIVQGMYHSTDHTGIAVPVMAYGPGSNLFRGIYQNTEIYHKIVSLLRLIEAK
jgi:alkaline phosphatase